MSRSPHRFPLLLAALLAGCNTDPAGPGDVVIGTWGAVNIGFESRSTSTTLRLPCTASIEFPVPVVADPVGRFSLPAVRVDEGSARERVLELRGQVAGRELRLDIVSTPTLPPSVPATAHAVLLRDGDSAFTVLCPHP
jgi:hypothetical protein